MRGKATKSEKILWKYLQKSQMGYKFTRQHSINNWIVDFYCHQIKLAIEVDGESHKTKKVADIYRDRYLEGMGIKVLRVRNTEITNNIEKVLENITLSLRVSPS